MGRKLEMDAPDGSARFRPTQIILYELNFDASAGLPARVIGLHEPAAAILEPFGGKKNNAAHLMLASNPTKKTAKP